MEGSILFLIYCSAIIILFNIQEAFGFVRLVLSGWCNVLFHHELAMVMEGIS